MMTLEDAGEKEGWIDVSFRWKDEGEMAWKMERKARPTLSLLLGLYWRFRFALRLFPFVSRVLVFQGNPQNSNLFDVYICLAHKTVVLNFLFKSLSQSLLSCMWWMPLLLLYLKPLFPLCAHDDAIFLNPCARERKRHVYLRSCQQWKEDTERFVTFAASFVIYIYKKKKISAQWKSCFVFEWISSSILESCSALYGELGVGHTLSFQSA